MTEEECITTYVSIDIQGFDEVVIYTNLELTQSVLDHHYFSFIWKYGDLQSNMNFQTKMAGDFIGKKVIITFRETIFSGIITSISAKESHNAHQGFLISGCSHTILLEDGNRSASYYKKDLSEILPELLKGIPWNFLRTKFKPTHKGTLFYTVQYNESDFEFIKRLAIRYGEWMYYYETELVFGEPLKTEIELHSGMDLYSYEIKAAIKPFGFHYVSYDGFKGENVEGSWGEVNSVNNDFSRLAVKGTKDSYLDRKDRKMHVSHMHNSGLIDQTKELEKEAALANMVVLEGHSKHPDLIPGIIVKIINTAGDEGKYIITRVRHYAGLYGQYENYFEAIPASVSKPPYTNPHLVPITETQSAVVKYNHDEDGLGRVKVQFPWQAPHQVSPWLRIVSPHAGGDKGFHFIPEKGEEVLIGFEGGNAEKPYVLGSMYHGAGKSGHGDEQNNIKSLKTRSGHTIELNDTNGEEKIKIHDNGGSIIIFDTQAKSLFINAAENIELTAKNIKMVAEENIEMQAQGNINTASVGDTTFLSEGNTSLQAKGDTEISSNASITIAATTENKITGQNVAVEGQTGAKLKGIQTKIEGQVIAVQGAAGKIDVV